MAMLGAASNLRVPPLPTRAVPRERLADALERGILNARVLLVSAPAGYGKTTVLAQWARLSQYPVVWVSLDGELDDRERLFRNMMLAWEFAQPGVRESPPGILLGSIEPDFDAVLDEMIVLAGDLPGHLAIVIDDAHLITTTTTQQALTSLVDRMPPTLHLVLGCRGAPPIPLARYRALGKVLEIDTAELQLRVDEAESFLNGAMGLDLEKDEVATLLGPLEGWVAGLQLAALTLQRHRQNPDKLVISGRHRFISDYFREDVLAQLPGDLRQFMMCCSVLDRMSGSLCNELTGRSDSRDILEQLERTGLFVVPLDDNREWFRFHRLFADHLGDELTRHLPGMVAELHRRAGRWLLAHNMPEPALRHAIAGDDAELGTEIFIRHIGELLNTGELVVLRRWIDWLPVGWFDTYPALGLANVGWLIGSGEFMAGISQIEDVAQRVARSKANDRQRQLALVAAVRCFIACGQNAVADAESFAEQSLRDLAPEDHTFRADIYHALGDTYRRNGRWDEARTAYLKVMETSHAPYRNVLSAHVFGALADLELMRGHIRVAADHWAKALAAVEARENWGRLPGPVTGWVYVRIGEIQYERNALLEAADAIPRGLERAQRGGDIRTVVAGSIIHARLKLTEGDRDAAVALLDGVRSLIDQGGFPEWTGRFQRIQVELWLAQGKLLTAVDWADSMMQSEQAATYPEHDVTQLAIARVLVIHGDPRSLERARPLLAEILADAQRDGRGSIEIEARAVQAMACERQGDRMVALTSLEHALRLAEPEGYVRLFADLGLPMAHLLQEARIRHVLPNYVDTLLAAFGASPSHRQDERRRMPEPLSHREQEVLRLIAAGLTNSQIADSLFISPETVKKHTGSILGKLGAGNRTEAAARARELAMLD